MDPMHNSDAPAKMDTTFTVNQALYEKLLKINQELTLFNARLKKIEEYRATVSVAVFEKVRNEYQQKREQYLQEINACKVELTNEIQNLSQARIEYENILHTHQTSYEEAYLRQLLGEFPEAKLQEIQASHQGEIERATQNLQQIAAVLKAYTDVIGEAGLMEVDTEPSVPRLPVPDAAPAVTAPMPELEEATIAVSTPIAADVEMEEAATVWSQPDFVKTEAHFPHDATPKPLAKLIVLKPEDLALTFPLKTENIIGRSKSCDIQLNDDTVSRRHAIIKIEKDQFHIQDQGSANGIAINGNPATEGELHDGDEITLGIFTLRFQRLPSA